MGRLLEIIMPTAEILSFAATVCLAVVAVYALKQIALMKADMIARSDRAAKEKAIDASSAYLCSFVPLWNKYFFDCTSRKMPAYDGPVGDFSLDSLPSASREAAKNRLTVISWLPAINRLEAIAASFTTGVADERVGFGIIGRTFCGSVRNAYDILCVCRGERSNPYFNNVVKLYLTWAPRLSKDELSAARDDIERIMLEIPETQIRPLGPDVPR